MRVGNVEGPWVRYGSGPPEARTCAACGEAITRRGEFPGDHERGYSLRVSAGVAVHNGACRTAYDAGKRANDGE